MARQAADADIEEAAEDQSREYGIDENKQSHAFRQYRTGVIDGPGRLL
jgi:hypothetical protein